MVQKYVLVDAVIKKKKKKKKKNEVKHRFRIHQDSLLVYKPLYLIFTVLLKLGTEKSHEDENVF